MSFVFGFLGAILGIIVVGFVIVFIVISKIKKSVGKEEFKQLKELSHNSKEILMEMSETPKSVNGMTTLVEPQVLNDFPDFNKELIYSKIESNLRTVFNEIENLKIEKNQDLELVNDTLLQQINDFKEQNIKIKFDNVVFHKHALKRYEKSNGIATITTSSTLEYNYFDSRKKSNNFLKTQTRYTCKFIYIYDVTKIPKQTSNSVFIINCPNCGAPLTNLEKGECVYCGSHIEEVNLKTWKMSSFSDDYKNI